MKFDIEKNDETGYAVIHTVVSPDDYYPEFQKELKNYGRKVNLKGFRPGKVPTTVVRNMFGKSIILDTFSKLFEKGLKEFLLAESLEPMANFHTVGGAYPSPEELFAKAEVSISLGTLYVPSVELDFGQYTFEAEKAEATPEEIDERLTDYLEQQTKDELVDDASQEGDFLLGVLTQQLEKVEGASALEQIPDVFDDIYMPISRIAEEARPAFVGKKAGEAVTFGLRQAFPENSALRFLLGLDEEIVEGLQGTYEFDIDAVKRPTPAQLTQELFDQAFGPGQVTTEEEFKAKYAEVINASYQSSLDQMLQNEIREKIVESFPVRFDEKHLQYLLDERAAAGEALDFTIEQLQRVFAWQSILRHISKTYEIRVESSHVANVVRRDFQSRMGFSFDQYPDKMIFDFVKNIHGEQASSYLEERAEEAQADLVLAKLQELVQVNWQPTTLTALEEKWKAEQEALAAKEAAETPADMEEQTVSSSEEENPTA